MSNLSLLSLPAEVRLNIYSYLFDDECLHIDQHTESPHPKQNYKPALAPILRTCRYLRDEAGPSYFSKVNVHFTVRKALPCTSLIHWLDSIGESNVRLLRNMTMRWENYVEINLALNRNARTLSKDINACVGVAGQGQMNNSEGSKTITAPSLELPLIMLGDQILFQAPVFNPTTSTQIGQRHILTMKGVSDSPDRNQYWKANGTAEFCDTLTRYLSPRVGATLENRGLYMSSRELVEFVDDASNHAASMRWLWYW